MARCLFEPRGIWPIAPLGERFGQSHIANELAASFVIGFLQRQRLVVDEPARPGETAHIALPPALRHEFKFEGLQALHDQIIFGL